ncbi:MAG: 6-phosphofructokinase [Thermodesulfobacteriota bacterium]
MEGKYRILIVDAEAASRNHIRNVLEVDADFVIEEAESGDEAFRRMKKNVPDIVIVDQALPDMNGLAFCSRLKEDPESPLANTYLVLVGGEAEGVCMASCIQAGADDVLQKPVNPEELMARVKVGRRVAFHMKKTELKARKAFREIDVLLIQEGGCAPGYNPVTAFITYTLETMGREVFATREGFRSLVSGRREDFVRLVYDPELYKKLDYLPGVFHAAPLVEWRGALLRGERYREFVKDDMQKKGAATIKKRKVRAIIAIGGNGTFKGIRSLCEILPTSIQAFFVPVTIDSDVAGTDCIGQHTGVEMGAEKIRCYMADARTHKRTYIVEMMGASSGFHALNSCLGARAHLAVLPGMEIDHRAVVEAVNRRGECVIVVAEGYRKAEREAEGSDLNAAEYFYKELVDTGIPVRRKVVCEPFSRDIRGAAPNNQDVTLAQRMAYNVASYLKAGTSRLMPAVLSGREHAIPFNEICTDNMKAADLLVLSNRLTNT